MKIAFVDIYRSGASTHKDPVTIPMGLRDLGHEVTLISCDPLAVDPFELAGFTVVPAAQSEKNGWRESRFDVAIVFSRFSHALTGMLIDIKAAGIPLVVKGDTDGTLGYPLKPNYLRIKPLSEHPSNLFRQLKWRLPIRYWVGQKMAHVALANAVVVESPGAAANLMQVLRFWGREEDAAKVRFLTNQVSQGAIEAPVQTEKPRDILAIGRWEDDLCKGADLLAASVTELLGLRGDYHVSVIGSGIQQVRRRLPEALRDRVLLHDEMRFDDLQKLTAQARILAVTSRVESFSFVTAEALCAGASVVVTPIESLTYLAGGGAWGTVARDFTVPAITASLLSEIKRWEDADHDPAETATYWRRLLAPERAAKLWARLIHDIAA